MGDTRAAAPKLWTCATPMTYITRDDPPFFFLHGENDTVVPCATSQKMHEALKAAKVPTQRKVYRGFAHISLFSNVEVVDDIVKFYDQALKKQRALKQQAARKSDQE